MHVRPKPRQTDAESVFAVNALEGLYQSLDVPDTDIRSAWNLINPSAASSINKDACLAFLHILNNRHEGYRIPRTVPASLRTSFERKQINYHVDGQNPSSTSRWATRADDETSTGRKAKFGDQYLTRLGRSGFKAAGTDFSTAKTDDWEEVRLKKQLAELDDKLDRIEQHATLRRPGGQRDSKPALVKRELDQLLDYKRRQLRDLEEGKGKSHAGGNLRGVHEDLQTVKEQVEGLESHLKSRREMLEQLKREIEREKT